MPSLHGFISFEDYRQHQSEIIKNNWLKGVYDHKIKKLVTRKCKNPLCSNIFKVKPYDHKMFCSTHCAAVVNNKGRVTSRETKLKIASSICKKPVTILKSEIPKKSRFLLPPFIITKEVLENLYIDEELSASDIAKKYHVTVWQVIKKLKKYNIPRRTSSQSNNIKFLKKPASYNFKTNLTLEEKILYNSAVMLYWGEGAKSQRTRVDLANGDEKMIKLFLKALREVFRIDESRLRGHIYCYGDQDVRKLEIYWSKLLNIPLNKFIKSYVRKDFNPKKKGKLPHGVMHIIYSDKKLYMQIMGEIDKIAT